MYTCTKIKWPLSEWELLQNGCIYAWHLNFTRSINIRYTPALSSYALVCGWVRAKVSLSPFPVAASSPASGLTRLSAVRCHLCSGKQKHTASWDFNAITQQNVGKMYTHRMNIAILNNTELYIQYGSSVYSRALYYHRIQVTTFMPVPVQQHWLLSDLQCSSQEWWHPLIGQLILADGAGHKMSTVFNDWHICFVVQNPVCP